MGEAVHVWEQEANGKTVPSSQFCCEPKTALKKVPNVNKSIRLVQK